MLENLRRWLRQWPGWAAAPDIGVDGLALAGGAVSLRPRGASESRFQPDILGRGMLHTVYRFWLELRLEKPPWDGDAGVRNAALMLALQDWVNSENAHGRVPALFESGSQSVRAVGGVLQEAGPDGLARYQMELAVEHTAQMKGDTDGEQ